MKKSTIVLLLLLVSMTLSSCSNNAGSIVDGYTQVGNLKLEQVQMPKKDEEIAVITTNRGEIKMRLF